MAPTETGQSASACDIDATDVTICQDIQEVHLELGVLTLT